MRAPNRSVELRLLDILRAIAGIQGTVRGLRYENYITVWSVKHASERGLEIISEASRHIPEDLKDKAPEIPWRQIAGIGNVLRHSYESFSDHVAWDIIQNHLDPLEAAVRGLLDSLENQTNREPKEPQ
jgi:uncharacterized protein with HEPN domain